MPHVPLSTSVGEDFLAFDGLEPVTVYAPLAVDGTAVAHALRRLVSEAEAAASDGRYTAQDVKWHLPAEELAAPPALAARIVDAEGDIWEVARVDRATFRTRWVAWSRRLAIDAGPEQRVTIQQATVAKDAHGAAETTWSDWQTDVLARVQPLARAVEVEHGQRLTRATHVVYLGVELWLGEQHRLIHNDVAYHVLRQRRPSRLVGWSEVEVMQTPWPTAARAPARSP